MVCVYIHTEYFSILQDYGIKKLPKSTENRQKNAILVFGPTASGKTSFGISLAQSLKNKGQSLKPVILNADSLQIYKGLPILTACPTKEEYNALAHEHFEILHPKQAMSVGEWWQMTMSYLQAMDQNTMPIIIGGTGFYLKSFVEGLPNTPEADFEIREALNQEQEEIGQEAFYKKLEVLDPQMAEKLEPNDKQRVLRAMEVLKSTGKSLSWWHSQPPKKPDFEINTAYIQLSPDREWLYERCNRRFDLMVGDIDADNSVLTEIDSFIETYGSDDFDLCRKAIGFDELKKFQTGDLDLNEAIEKAKQRTRNYAKRQSSWSRTQMNFEKDVAFWRSLPENFYTQNQNINDLADQILKKIKAVKREN